MLLEGKAAIAACSRSKADSLVAGLAELGASVVLFEAIQIRPVEDRAPLEAAVRELDGYSWLVFTSGHAVDFFAAAVVDAGRRTLPSTLRVCAVGPATAERARAAGFGVDLIPREFVGDDAAAALVSAVRGEAGTRVLFPRARAARDVIPEALERAGAHVDVVPVYETVAAAGGAALEEALRRKPDLLVFTSPSTVESFVAAVGEEDAAGLFAAAIVAAIGPVTAATLSSFGKKADIVPAEHTVPGLLDAIGSWFSR
jgi:uroporphyrinogen III methyltransferase / synthase